MSILKLIYKLLLPWLCLILFYYLNFRTVLKDFWIEDLYIQYFIPFLFQYLTKFSSYFIFSLTEIYIYSIILGVIIFTYYYIRKPFFYLTSLGWLIFILYLQFLFSWGYLYQIPKKNYFLKTTKPYNHDGLSSNQKKEDTKKLLKNIQKTLIKLNPQKYHFLENTQNNYPQEYYNKLAKKSLKFAQDKKMLSVQTSRFLSSSNIPSPVVKYFYFNKLIGLFAASGFFAYPFYEIHLNERIAKIFHPFTLVHEVAHLLGVTSEKEANQFALEYFLSEQEINAKRSFIFYLFIYLSNELDKKERNEWLRQLPIYYQEQIKMNRNYWNQQNKTIRKINIYIYDFFLKYQGISEGIEEYNYINDWALQNKDKLLQFLEMP